MPEQRKWDQHDEGPFDGVELIQWATTYGHPEGWAKRAQAAHMRAERLHIENERLRVALEAIASFDDHPGPVDPVEAMREIAIKVVGR